MAEKQQAQTEPTDRRKSALYTGLWVFMLLGVFTFGEYLVGVIAPPWGQLLLIVAALKAFWVIKDYMHIGRIFRNDEETH